jgi:vancomycin resistance protein YoaR
MGDPQTTASRIIFSAKVLGLRARRALQELGRRPRFWPQVETAFEGARTEIRSPLFVDHREEERVYELGKVENLRLAISSLNGVVVPAGKVFSFWRQIGNATARRGFVRGRMLQAGCVIPAIGGGLCQLSNALYELALRTGCEIIERHPHSHRLPGMPANDATVAWNYIDLRFRPPFNLRLDFSLTEQEMVASFVYEVSEKGELSRIPIVNMPEPSPTVMETCATCAQKGCSRHEASPNSGPAKSGLRPGARQFLDR